jgi:hypothetical protein
MIGSFGSNVQTLVTEQTDLNQDFPTLLNEKKLQKVEQYSLKVLLDFCPNSSFNTAILKKMLGLSSNLLAKFKSARSQLFQYLSEVNEFFEFVKFFRSEDKAIEIGELENCLRTYEKVDTFLDDLVTMVTIFWGIVSTPSTNFSTKDIEKVYSVFKDLNFVSDVLRVFSEGRETIKLRAVKSLWDTLRIQIV